MPNFYVFGQAVSPPSLLNPGRGVWFGPHTHLFAEGEAESDEGAAEVFRRKHSKYNFSEIIVIPAEEATHFQPTTVLRRVKDSAQA